MSNPISFIPRIYKPSQVIPIEIDDVLDWIRTGLSIRQNLIQITDRIHNTSDHDSRSQLKYWNLPVVLFNGEFSYKSKEHLVCYSSYTALDFDNWKISRIRSAGNCKKCPLKKRSFQRTLCVC